jgi:hypothetical protein
MDSVSKVAFETKLRNNELFIKFFSWDFAAMVLIYARI